MKDSVFGNVVLPIGEGKFELGYLVMTRGVHSDQAGCIDFAHEVSKAFARYVICDWGDMCAADKRSNDRAVKSGDDRILAAYMTSKGKQYIITEWDRSVTTIMFASEY